MVDGQQIQLFAFWRVWDPWKLYSLRKKRFIIFFLTASHLLVLKTGTTSLKNNVKESEPTHQIPGMVAGVIMALARFVFIDRKALDAKHTQGSKASRGRFGSKLQSDWCRADSSAESVGEQEQTHPKCTASESYFLTLPFIKGRFETSEV